MRSRLRAVGFVALTIVAITCTESPTGPGGAGSSVALSGRLAMAPRFSAEAAQAFTSLAASGVDVAEVHIRLTAADASIRDTVVAFPLGRDTLLIEIPISINGDEQEFTALIELRSADHVVLFSGTQRVVARARNLPALPPAVITISYTGPGRSTRSVTLSPPDTTVLPTATLPFRASAVDSSGRPVTDLLVSWTSSDATLLTLVSTGDAAATGTALGRRGTVTIRAATPSGIIGTSRITIVPPPARLVLISGGGQSALVGTALPQPMVVELQASDNGPVSGAQVTFRAVTSGGSVQTVSVVTDAAGRASSTLRLGNVAGSYQFEAVSGSLPPVVATVTATPAPASVLAIVSGDAQTDTVGKALPLPLVVRVTDALGNPVSGAIVTWSKLAGLGSLGSTTATTGSNGTASTTYILGVTPGSDTVRASIAGAGGATVSVQFTMRTVLRGPSGLTIISGAGQVGAPNTTLALPIVALIVDATNAPVANVPVTWSTAAGGATFTPATSLTALDGKASTFVKLGTTPGTVTIVATSGALSAAGAVTITGTAAVVTKFLVLQGPPATITVGQSIPQVKLQLADATGAPVQQSGVSVTATASVLPSGSTFTASTTTDVSGIATLALPPYTGAIGTGTLTVTASGITPFVSSPIPILTGSAFAIALNAGDGQTASPGTFVTIPPSVKITDAGGNPVAGHTVLFDAGSSGAQIANGGVVGTQVNATSNTAGIAALTQWKLGSVVQSYTLTASSVFLSGSPVTFTATAALGAVTQLVVVTSQQTGGILSTLAQPIVVEARDAGNNPVPGVTVIVSPLFNASRNGVASVSSAVTNASGQISFTWKLSQMAKVDSIALTTPAAGITSYATAIATPGPATQLVIKTPTPLLPNNAIPTGGFQWAPYIVVVTDSGGIDTVSSSAPITLAIKSGTGAPGAELLGPTTVNAVNGLATFTGLAIDKASNTYQIDATSPSLISATSAAFGINVGGPTQLVFLQQPTNHVGGTAMIPPVIVALADSGGNIIGSNSASTVTLAITGGSGTAGAVLSGGGPVTFIAGVATFPLASVDISGTGYTLTATTTAGHFAGGGIAARQSAAFNVSPGAFGSITAKPGFALSIDAVGAVNPSTRPVFVVKNASGAFATNVPVTLTSVGRCLLDNGSQLLSTLIINSDAIGEVQPLVRLPSGADGAGCVIKASATTVTAAIDSSLIAVYPTGTTHVWLGLVDALWTTPNNWARPGSTPAVPSSPSDQIFIPRFAVGAMIPRVVGTRPLVRRLALDTAAILDLGTIGIDLGSQGMTGFGLLSNGTARLTTTASLNGIFDQLDIGQSGFCGAAAPMTGTLVMVSANTLNVYCRTNIDTTAVVATTVNTFANLGQGWLSITSNRAALQVSGNANFAGDSTFVLGGTMYIVGGATFGGGHVIVTSGSQVIVQGAALFNATVGGDFSGATLSLSNATFGGAGAGQNLFSGGTLNVSGNFSQVAGSTPLTFTTSNNHITNFIGTSAQSVSFANPTSSMFSIVQVTNSSGGVTLATNAQTLNSTNQPRVSLTQGTLNVSASTTFGVNGGMVLGSGTTLNILGAVTQTGGACTGRTTNNAFVTGTGTYNGSAITPLTCTP